MTIHRDWPNPLDPPKAEQRIKELTEANTRLVEERQALKRNLVEAEVMNGALSQALVAHRAENERLRETVRRLEEKGMAA